MKARKALVLAFPERHRGLGLLNDDKDRVLAKLARAMDARPLVRGFLEHYADELLTQEARRSTGRR